MKLFAFTLDLESDYSGCMDEHLIFRDLHKIEEVLSALNSLDVKITVFTVGSIFEAYPEVIRLFEKYECEFEAHSYSHDFRHPDSKDEIVRSRDAYYKYFGHHPRGYRAPRGDVSPEGIRLLEKYGFLYDASITPAFFPNPFRFLNYNKRPHYLDGTNVMEIPITPVSTFRLALSISYIKMIGVERFITLSNTAEMPDTVCFNSHLHDFIIKEDSFNKLFPVWRLLYGINKHKGMEFCERYLNFISGKGYRFCYMSEIYELNKR